MTEPDEVPSAECVSTAKSSSDSASASASASVSTSAPTSLYSAPQLTKLFPASAPPSVNAELNGSQPPAPCATTATASASASASSPVSVARSLPASLYNPQNRKIRPLPSRLSKKYPALVNGSVPMRFTPFDSSVVESRPYITAEELCGADEDGGYADGEFLAREDAEVGKKRKHISANRDFTDCYVQYSKQELFCRGDDCSDSAVADGGDLSVAQQSVAQQNLADGTDTGTLSSNGVSGVSETSVAPGALGNGKRATSGGSAYPSALATATVAAPANNLFDYRNATLAEYGLESSDAAPLFDESLLESLHISDDTKPSAAPQLSHTTAEPSAAPQDPSAQTRRKRKSKNRRKKAEKPLPSSAFRKPEGATDWWLCPICEYEMYFGVPPVNMIKWYERLERAEQRKQQERQHLLEKLRRKGRRGGPSAKPSASATPSASASPAPEDGIAEADCGEKHGQHGQHVPAERHTEVLNKRLVSQPPEGGSPQSCDEDGGATPEAESESVALPISATNGRNHCEPMRGGTETAVGGEAVAQ